MYRRVLGLDQLALELTQINVKLVSDSVSDGVEICRGGRSGRRWRRLAIAKAPEPFSINRNISKGDSSWRL